MKHLLILISLLFTTYLSAQEAGCTITISLDNVLYDNGDLHLTLHSEDSFGNTEGVRSLVVPATTDSVNLKLENIPPGVYALVLLHDLNGNKQMDFHPSGMPKEPYATSGSSMEMGPPKFSSIKFIHGEEDQRLHLRF